jgi:hypothetical protein
MSDFKPPDISPANCGGDKNCSLFRLCRSSQLFQCRNCFKVFNSEGSSAKGYGPPKLTSNYNLATERPNRQK